MIFAPILIAALLITAAASRQRRKGGEPLLVPTTVLGRVALASVVLMVVVALTDVSLAVTLPVGAVMLVLSVLAWWRERDRGLLLLLPGVFGVWTLVVPPLFE